MAMGDRLACYGGGRSTALACLRRFESIRDPVRRIQMSWQLQCAVTRGRVFDSFLNTLHCIGLT